MTVYESTEIEQVKESAVTLGNFDGIHKGHQKLISTVKEYAEKEGLTSIVFSFYPHPVYVLGDGKKYYSILSTEEKIHAMEKLGVDTLIQYPFTKEFAAWDTKEFFELLYYKVKCRVLVVGENYYFGRNRSGNYETLKKYGDIYGVKVIKINSVMDNNERVSSTRIRRCIFVKNFEEANRLLNKEYFIIGNVAQGKKIGRKIGFPTANLVEGDEKLLPPDGVYVTKTQIGDKIYNSMTNIGKNPTLNGTERTVETHLFNFKDDIYGEKIKVMFLQWLRDDVKFENIEQLESQLHEDMKNVKSIFAKI
ncbi:MAG: bifunctional riboflavin kinase/FAD synthetase [Firmicutes bacterium]|nr:bifunctional riboflavin kinase/FAD synthetase [Bacillota bacterium]